MSAYYNEFDPYAAQWLENLIAAGHIAPGIVDRRSITDVRAEELAEFDQCHFFAGIGGWSLALRLAGWPDERPVWTGSCPCQPFSASGKGGGFDDARHLWPTWFNIIREFRPGVVFGEQVASPAGLGWLDLVHADMEAAGYAFAAVDCCSAGIGAPHIRQRLGFVADAAIARSLPGAQTGIYRGEEGARARDAEPERSGSIGGLADADRGERDRLTSREGRERDGEATGRQQGDGSARPGGDVGKLADGMPGPTNGFWRNPDWLLCRDGKWRPVEPGTFPLAHGVPARVGRLRAYGNAINPHQFAEIIGAYMECAA